MRPTFRLTISESAGTACRFLQPLKNQRLPCGFASARQLWLKNPFRVLLASHEHPFDSGGSCQASASAGEPRHCRTRAAWPQIRRSRSRFQKTCLPNGGRKVVDGHGRTLFNAFERDLQA